MKKSKPIYTFENWTIYEDDYKKITGDDWLNDELIGLAGRKLEIQANKDCAENHLNVLFYPPNTLYLLRMIQKEMASEVTQYWNVFKAKYVFLPLYDSENCASEGSHWSLIVWDTQYSPNEENKFYHFDSLGCSSTRVARKVAKQLCEYYGVNVHRFFSPKSPQQNNSYDCGMFTIAIMEYIAKSMDLDKIVPNVSQQTVTQLRLDYQTKFMKD